MKHFGKIICSGKRTIINNYKIYNLVCIEMDTFNLGSDAKCWIIQDKYLIRLVIRELLIAERNMYEETFAN